MYEINDRFVLKYLETVFAILVGSQFKKFVMVVVVVISL